MKSTLSTLFLFLSLGLFAQMEQNNLPTTKAKSLELQFGVNYTQVNQEEGGEYWGKVSLTINEHLSLGLGAAGFFSAIAYDKYQEGNYMVEGNYGGIVAETVFLSNKFVYLSFPVLIGAGQISYVRQYDSWDPEGSYFVANDAVWAFVPAMEVNFSISRYVHLCLIGQYRFLSDVSIQHEGRTLLPKDIGSNWSVGLGLKFGNFTGISEAPHNRNNITSNPEAIF